MLMAEPASVKSVGRVAALGSTMARLAYRAEGMAGFAMNLPPQPLPFPPIRVLLQLSSALVPDYTGKAQTTKRWASLYLEPARRGWGL